MNRNKINIHIAVLAAGKGTRMKSEHPKVLHPICGKPMIRYVLETIKNLTAKNIFMIIGHQKEVLLKTLPDQVTPVIQDKQLGTGHAINQLANYFKGKNNTLIVLCADTPFISTNTLKNLLKQHYNSRSKATVLTCRIKNPKGYGRIVKENGEIKKIIEELDAGPNEKKIDEINTGIYCFETDALFKALKSVKTHNKKKEYYLTDVITILHSKGFKTSSFLITNENEIRGINTKIDLAWAEKYKRKEILSKHMLSGVTIIDPDTTFISENTKIGADTVIYPFSMIEGENIIGKKCSLGPQIKIKNCKIGNGSEIFFSVINESTIKDKTKIGPFTHIRPQTIIDNEAHLGSFVEIKKIFCR